MFTRAVRLTRIRGVEVRLDVSLLPFAGLVAWFFAVRFGDANGLPVALTMAAVGCVLFFGSILAHELAHALEARHRGLDVQRITLFLFGGITEMHAASQTPRDEFVVAAVGPWISLVCGAVFGLVSTFADALLPAGAAGPVAELAGLLAWINVVLAVFNLVPGAPLDGGRVLRAGLWWLLKDRRRALRIAARAGQLLAVAVVVLGIWGVQVAGFDGLFGGLMWVVLGIFVWSAAQAEIRQSDVDALLDGRRARDLVGVLPGTVAADAPLGQIVDDARRPADQLVPVVDRDGHLLGVVALKELQALHPVDRSAGVARDLMRHVEHLPRIGLDDDVRTLIDAFSGRTDAVRIHDGERDVAVVTEQEVARALNRLRRTGTPVGSRPAPEAAT